MLGMAARHSHTDRVWEKKRMIRPRLPLLLHPHFFLSLRWGHSAEFTILAGGGTLFSFILSFFNSNGSSVPRRTLPLFVDSIYATSCLFPYYCCLSFELVFGPTLALSFEKETLAWKGFLAWILINFIFYCGSLHAPLIICKPLSRSQHLQKRKQGGWIQLPTVSSVAWEWGKHAHFLQS